jgi:hypothetical protein
VLQVALARVLSELLGNFGPQKGVLLMNKRVLVLLIALIATGVVMAETDEKG